MHRPRGVNILAVDKAFEDTFNILRSLSDKEKAAITEMLSDYLSYYLSSTVFSDNRHDLHAHEYATKTVIADWGLGGLSGFFRSPSVELITAEFIRVYLGTTQN